MVRFGYTAFVALCGSCVALPAVAQQDQPSAARADFPSFDAIDANLDGVITRNEFADALPEVEEPDRLFAAADADGDELVGRQEWADWREQRVGALEKPPPEEDEIEHRRTVELEFTDETLQGRFSTDAGLVGLDGNRIGFGVLFSDDRDFVGSAELLAPGLLERFLPGFVDLKLGGRTYVALLDDPDDDVVAFAPGAQARVGIPFLENVPVAGVGEIFFAPDIVTFGDADKVVDFSGRVEVEFLERTTGFIGVRVLDFEREGGGDDTIVDGVMGGLRFRF